MTRRNKGKAPRPSPRRELSPWKKSLFALSACILFFLLIEVVLAVAGIRPVLYEEDPYVGFASNVPLYVEQKRSDGRVEMVTAANKLRWFNEQRFLRAKPSGTYRIFNLGGSTTYGRPYDDTASFSGWLRELLPRLDSKRRFDVINAGGISYASYRVAVVMEELARYEPDLFIIYTGHNEFLEERTYRTLVETPRLVTGLGAAASRTRLYSVVHGLVRAKRSEASPTVLGAEVDPLLEHSVGPSDYTRDDELRERAIAHFRFNLDRMIDIARSAGAEVLLVTPASNLKDCSPFKSEHRDDLGSSEMERFGALYKAAEQAREAGELEQALESLDEAATIDDRYAELHYRRGRLLVELERYEDARQALEKAIDEDICPLRALTPITRVVREVAAERHAPLVDFSKVVASISPHGITGADSFLDHVHFDYEGYRLLAVELVEAMERMGVIEPPDGWRETTVALVTTKIEGEIDDEAKGRALRNLAKVLAWAGKLEEAERVAFEATEILGEDPESLHTLGLGAAARGDVEEAIRHYERAVKMEPHFAKGHNSLGVALVSQKRNDDAIEHFRRAIEADADFAEAHYNLANALEAAGDLDEAVRYFRRALEAKPDFVDAGNNLGIALIGQGKVDEAIERFRELLSTDPDSAEGHQNLGIALMSQRELEEAMVHFRRALEIEPRFAEAHYYLGMSLAVARRLEEATGHFQQALEASPDYAAAHYNLANALSLLGRLKEGLPHYREAVRLRPDWVAPLSRLAWVLATASAIEDATMRDGDEAIGLAERLVELTRNQDAPALDTLAASYAAAGRFDRAVVTAERAIAAAAGEPGERVAAMRRRLELYKQAKPYREPVNEP